MSFESGRGNNNNSNKVYDKTYYSRLNFKDYTHNSKIRLGIQFRTGMLVLDMSTEKNEFEFESVEQIFITGTKAKILLAMMERYEKDIAAGTFDPANGYGINTGMGNTQTILILGLNDKNEKIITIAKVNQDGGVEKSHTYTFNTEFHYGLSWNNVSAMDFERIYPEDVEYQMLKNTVESFANNSNGVIAYTVADIARYDHVTILNKMNPIFDKLGIERPTGGNNNSRGNSGGGFFNNGGNRSSDHKSYEEMEDELPFDMD